jgi:hypothetical protein
MKNLLILAGLLASALSALSQGQIIFNNRVTTVTPNVDAKVSNNWEGGLPLSGINPLNRAALLGGPTYGVPASLSGPGSLSLLASPTTGATWVTFRTGAVAGYVAVGTDSARDSGLPYGSTGLFQMVAWQGTQTTWVEAYFAWKDRSIDAMFSNPLILPVSLGPTDLDVPTLQGLQPFAFGFPEPSAVALVFVGAAALTLGRRKAD